ncbi:hypothetical protein VNO78_02569 [Psophocarpus tetragonolobus]|uniref:Uncharacterized protein n=1 Tax=Psophocarpus tetragonolobus TaxID=3891 RepID=A0AAN9XVQ9_PSOTE
MVIYLSIEFAHPKKGFIDVELLERLRNEQLRIEKKKVIFENDEGKEFDVIVFPTGYKSVVNRWLKDYKYAQNEDGMPKNNFPSH